MSGGIPLCSQELLNLSPCFCGVITLTEVKSDMMEPIGVNYSEIPYGRPRIKALALWGMSQLYAKTEFV